MIFSMLIKMNKRINLGNRKQRTGTYAESKFTNCTQFDPGDSEIDQIFDLNYIYEKKSDEIVIIKAEKCNPHFIMPVTEQDILKKLKEIPKNFLEELKCIYLLGGSNKQLKASDSLFIFGRYWANCIFLHPYPKKDLSIFYDKLPKPSIIHEYKAAGAQVVTEYEYWIVKFDLQSLKNFYLNNVLIHEIGHHVDRNNKNRKKKNENFADWFAISYGLK
jgi:hypothetical protein